MKRPVPTQRERHFDESEIIVSKTDLKGRVTYANEVFCRIGMYSEDELVGKPHSIVRHPDMPRTVFHLLWERIKSGGEIFAYVKNLAKNGDYYWVLAHVTPSYGADGQPDGYHSNRRVPERSAVQAIETVYRDLLDVEAAAGDPREAVRKGVARLEELLKQRGQSYDEFVFSL
ncbi:MAG TPA: PAS domain-containing protein [Ferrovibrio sp.]|jgi:PAS domain S-box-containing protein|uniref:PAS domain-containing protein n=1 Tax=Ferrovibrio sp. TaxID=1917215 RepID=UPI002B4B48AC|nr:PAS domain-containing protein [Ferrovibrio sp.]HLT76807.1 PAS domain-containing protein [Ferrovibrio sp.]